MTIGTRVKDLMVERGLSQAELARRVGLTQPAIFALITRNKTGSKNLHRIARELGTTPAYLEGETDDPDADAPDPPAFKPEHFRLIEYYEALGPVEQTALLTIAASMAGERPAGQLQAPAAQYQAGGKG
jgi:transcriptional regulator with XRE-family HTH domain